MMMGSQKNLRRYVRQVLQEALLSPADPRGFKSYYDIDPQNPPPVQDIIDTWSKNHAQIYDSCINSRNPAWYDTKDLTQFREYQAYELRNPTYTDRYQELADSIRQNGIRDPIIIEIGANGRAKIGEGNHRHQIALQLGLKKVPVRFLFKQEVTMTSDLWRKIEEPQSPVDTTSRASAPIDAGKNANLQDDQSIKDLMSLMGFD